LSFLPSRRVKRKLMKLLQALASGLAGACALTLLHESVRRVSPDAPRMDVLGMRAIAKSLRKADQQPPTGDRLFYASIAGDLVSNTLYYSFTGTGSGVWGRGAMLGLVAGIGAVALPGPLGLGEAPSNRTTRTQVMTVALYLAGGLAAAGASRLLAGKRNG
jgi:hypothetical protein